MQFLRRPARHTGVALVMQFVLVVVVLGFVSLGVDWARVQLIKTQLYRSADAAARAAAASIYSGSSTSARSAATTAFTNNSLDGGVKSAVFADAPQ